MKLSPHTWGTIITITGAMIISPDSLTLRLVDDLPNETVLVYKFLLFTGGSFVILAFYHRGGTFVVLRSITHLEIIAGFLWGLLGFCIGYAIQTTSAANALCIYSCGPIFASIFSRIILKDAIPWRTIVTAIVCFSAIIIIFSTEFGSSTSSSDAVGVINALAAAVTVGVYFVYMKFIEKKYKSQPDPFLVNALSGLTVVILALAIGGEPEKIDGLQFLYICIGGILVITISCNLITIGSQYISPPESSMFLLLEVVFGPFWVWLAGYETPPPYTLLGGALLVTSLFVHSLLALREEQLQMKGKALIPMESLGTEIKDTALSSDATAKVPQSSPYKAEDVEIEVMNVIVTHTQSDRAIP